MPPKSQNDLLTTISEETKPIMQSYHRQPSELAHAVANLTSLQRRTWNILARNFVLNVITHPDQTPHGKLKMKIPLTVLAEAADVRRSNLKHLHEELVKLKRTPIVLIRKWEDGKPNKDNWYEINWLSGISNWDPDTDYIEYEISETLAEILLDPQQWARLSLPHQRTLKRSRAAHLYEFFADYRPTFHQDGTVKFGEVVKLDDGSERVQAKTGVIDLDYLRQLLEATDDYYQEYKRFKSKIIDPELKKIRDNTDIAVSYTTVKQGRSVVGLNFAVSENFRAPFSGLEDLANNEVFTKLVRYKIQPIEAQEFIKEYTEEYLLEKIEYLKKRMKANLIKSSPAGYLRKAILNNYVDADIQQITTEVKQEEVSKRKQKQAEQEQQKKNELRRQREQEQHEVDQFLATLNSAQREQLETEFRESANKWERNGFEKKNPSRTDKIVTEQARRQFFLKRARGKESNG